MLPFQAPPHPQASSLFSNPQVDQQPAGHVLAAVPEYDLATRTDNGSVFNFLQPGKPAAAEASVTADEKLLPAYSAEKDGSAVPSVEQFLSFDLEKGAEASHPHGQSSFAADANTESLTLGEMTDAHGVDYQAAVESLVSELDFAALPTASK